MQSKPLRWYTINNLLTHPATLQALSSELITANLTLPYPKWNEVCDLPYLDACIQEAVRLHPPFALVLGRVVPAGGVTVLNHYLPEGTLVGGNPYVVNRHAETFGPDVEEWRPERWLEGEGRKRLEQSVPTFDAGRRVCLGKYIGILELKRLVPFLVLKYDMKIIDPERFSVENGFFFKQRGFYCNITRRKEGSDRDKADPK
ncbi:cytochrome P450 [Aspergillus flavus]|nr:cytochrome P450 [Aspergillus flavus]RAQ71683.1 cytochrome P450 [Aspergillus flavus]